MEHTPATTASSKKMWGAIGLNLLLLVGIGSLAKWNYESNVQTKWKEWSAKKKA